MKQKRQRTQKAKSLPADLLAVADGALEGEAKMDAPEKKARKRRSKEPDPNAPPVFGAPLCGPS